MTTKTPVLTPFIAITANYFGLGNTAIEARQDLVKVGGSASERQIVYQLPDGATDAFVAANGKLYWYDTPFEAEAKPVASYLNGKAVKFTDEEAKPVKCAKPPKGKLGAAIFDHAAATKAQDEPELAPVTIKPKKGVKAKPVTAVVTSEVVGEEIAEDVIEPEPAPVPEPAPAKTAPKGKLKSVPQQAQPTVASAPTVPEAVAAKPEPKKGKAAAPATKEAQPEVAANFLLFVGSAAYTKDQFITDTKTGGISRRMVTHRLPKGLVCGVSKVFLAAEGVRSSDGAISEVFGWFTPSHVEFVDADGDETARAAIKADLSARADVKFLTKATETKVSGGTYLAAPSPVKILGKVAKYQGNHFRGMMRLDGPQSIMFNTGGTVTTLIDEHCMNCGEPMKCAPDGHMRAERERKRIAKGEEPKWRLLDAKCATAMRQAAKGLPAPTEEAVPEEAAEPVGESDQEPADVTEDEEESDPSAGTD